MRVKVQSAAPIISPFGENLPRTKNDLRMRRNQITTVSTFRDYCVENLIRKLRTKLAERVAIAREIRLQFEITTTLSKLLIKRCHSHSEFH